MTSTLGGSLYFFHFSLSFAMRQISAYDVFVLLLLLLLVVSLFRSRLAEETSRRQNAELVSDRMKQTLSRNDDQLKQSVIC